jgi:EAL domain-containing protein (putative c-di-GMP-specific phosphodiesterase class I)
VIAEGVETQEQLDYLRYLKCDSVQGHIYYKPLLDIEIQGMLKRGDIMSKCMDII